MRQASAPRALDAVQRLKPLAKQADCTLSQFALAWVLREPNVASAIVGASGPEQLEENAKAYGLKVDPPSSNKPKPSSPAPNAAAERYLSSTVCGQQTERGAANRPPSLKLRRHLRPFAHRSVAVRQVATLSLELMVDAIYFARPSETAVLNAVLRPVSCNRLQSDANPSAPNEVDRRRPDGRCDRARARRTCFRLPP
jgi:hypothetical protein